MRRHSSPPCDACPRGLNRTTARQEARFGGLFLWPKFTSCELRATSCGLPKFTSYELPGCVPGRCPSEREICAQIARNAAVLRACACYPEGVLGVSCLGWGLFGWVVFASSVFLLRTFAPLPVPYPPNHPCPTRCAVRAQKRENVCAIVACGHPRMCVLRVPVRVRLRPHVYVIPTPEITHQFFQRVQTVYPESCR